MKKIDILIENIYDAMHPREFLQNILIVMVLVLQASLMIWYCYDSGLYTFEKTAITLIGFIQLCRLLLIAILLSVLFRVSIAISKALSYTEK